MTNLNNIKIKNSNYINTLYLDDKSSKLNDLGNTKHYPPTNKEWFNSIYSYNKSYTKLLPITDKIVNNLLKSYFHLTSSLEKSKLKSKNMRIRNKRLSADRIYLSRAEMKHTNNKVIITLYTYNRTIFCNGLTIIRKNIWINKSISIIKKSFYSGIVNFSRKLVFSKIFSNIINPFGGLVKKKKTIKQKRLYITEFIENLSINKPFFQKLNIKPSMLINNLNFKFKPKFKQLLYSPKLINLKNEILCVYTNIFNYYIYKYSILQYIDKKNNRYKILSKLYIPKAFLNFSVKTKINSINLNAHAYNIKFIYDKLTNWHKNLVKDTRFYGKNIKKIFSILKFYTLVKINNKNIDKKQDLNLTPLNSKLYTNYNLYKIKKYIELILNKELKKKILYKNLLTLSNSIYKEVKNIQFYRNTNSIFNSSIYLKKRYNFVNLKKIIYIFKEKSSFISNTLNNLKKIQFKNKNIDGKMKFKRFTKIMNNLHSFTNKIYKPNFIKFIYIFEVLNIKNPISSSYYFTQIYKKYKFIKYNRETLSIKKILYLKIDYKKFNRKIKLIKNSRIFSMLPKTSFTFFKNKFINFYKISDNKILSPITQIIYSPQYKTINDKHILILQSNNILRKKLSLVLPLYIYYVQMIYINKYKYKNWFLLNLKNILYNIYKKKIEFNIINLKYIHLNSDMLSESMAIKLRNRKNRILKVLNKVLRLIKVSVLHEFLKEKFNKVCFNKYKTLNIYSNLTKRKITVKKIIDSLKYKNISGIRLEAAGRLTKRLTASRSISKLKHKGSLKNIDSSYKNLPSVILRGHMKPNLQYTQINSKTRNGAFGLKTWISSY